MPTYDYECSTCQHAFEESLRIAEMDIPLSQPCPKCGAENAVKRVIVSAAKVIACDPFKSLNSDHKYALQQMKKRHPNSTIKDY